MKKILLAIALLITSGIYAASYNRPGIPSVLSDTTPQLGGNLDPNGNNIVQGTAARLDIVNDTSPLGIKLQSQGADFKVRNESGAGGGPFIDALAASAVFKLGSDGIAAQPYAYLQGASSDSFIDLNGLIAGGSTLQGGNGGVELKTLGSGHISLLPSGLGLVKLGADLQMGGNGITQDVATQLEILNDSSGLGVRLNSQGSTFDVFNKGGSGGGSAIEGIASGAMLQVGNFTGTPYSLLQGPSNGARIDMNKTLAAGTYIKGEGSTGVQLDTTGGANLLVSNVVGTDNHFTAVINQDIDLITSGTGIVKYNGVEISTGGGGYGECSMQGNGTVTTINSVGVFEDADGTAVAGLLSDFTFAGADNSLTYTGTATKIFRIIASGAFLGKKDKDLIFSIAKNGTEQSKFRQTVQPKDNNKEQPFSISGLVSFATNDKINLVVTNIASTDDPTIFDMNLSVME